MKSIILDIDHCLVFASYSELPEQKLISQRGYHYLYFRPYLSEFLSFVQKSKFRLIFYTSGKSEYAKWIVSQFQMNCEYSLFTRKFTKCKQTEFGELFYKSSDKLPVKKTGTTYVVDDRIDLWDDNGEIFFGISPWRGEVNDTELQRIIIQLLKKQPLLKELHSYN